MTGGSQSFAEADLHGLVDGRLEPTRQAELLHRMRSHPDDRARIETWRDQNDLLRATFAEVEHEPIPVSLDLAPPPRLRCVASDGLATALPTIPFDAPVAHARKRASLLIAFGVSMAGIVLAGAWLLFAPSAAPPRAVASTTTLEDGLAAKVNDALSRQPIAVHPVAAHDPPITTIPDLGEAGFGFTSATMVSNEPPTIVFLFENDKSERVAIAVAGETAIRRDLSVQAMPIQLGRAILWHRDGAVFAMAGGVEARRLGAMALDLSSGPVERRAVIAPSTPRGR